MPSAAYQRPDGKPYAIGGLWDPVGAGDGSPAFLLLTVEANHVVAPCHHRMALIVPQLRWDAWLDPRDTRAQGDVDDRRIGKRVLYKLIHAE